VPIPLCSISHGFRRPVAHSRRGLAGALIEPPWWRLPRGSWSDIGVVGVLSGLAVLVWRLSANMPALNDDGLPPFSANDWAAPVLTFVVLSVYADLRSAR